MLMALLYGKDERLVAAAPACDQVPYGDQYWHEFHAAAIDQSDMLETAYVTVNDPTLQKELLQLGIDDSLNPKELELRLKAKTIPAYAPKAA